MKVLGQQNHVSLFSNDAFENINLSLPHFNSHLITYIGNKRRLLPFLHREFNQVKRRLGKSKLVVFDGFAGSGAVARLLKALAEEIHVNDLENYAHTINSAYLTNSSEIDLQILKNHINWLNDNKIDTDRGRGFIETNYAPIDDSNVQPGERVFYTNVNAKIIDTVRTLIDQIPEPYKTLTLAALLVKASIHTNTSGVFKGFHKKNGVGHFGGQGENALSRIKREIVLETPILSDFECAVHVHKEDINKLVTQPDLPYFDLAYFDPPYNQHPYGSNYFMLNIINDGGKREIQDGVSGISKEWNKSAYNKSKIAEEAMDALLEKTNAKIIAISYNNEGIIPMPRFKELLSKHGKWTLSEQEYNTYRGSRNLRARDIKVNELLWILEKN